MNQDLKKLLALLCACVALAGVILVSNNGLTLQGLVHGQAQPVVTLLEQPAAGALQVTGETALQALVLYSPGREDSVQYEKNIRLALKHLRIGAQSLELDRTQTVSYTDYDLVILADRKSVV